MFERYYALLGVQPGIEERDLKKVYRKLAMKFHPDVNKNPGAGEHFREICEAYEIVLHQEKKDAEIYASDDWEVDVDPSVYEKIILEAREKAQARARMKYERLKAEREFFNNNDFFIMLRYAGHFLIIPVAAAMIVFPVYLAITDELMILFPTSFFWIIGIVIFSHIYSNRRTWFRLGKLKLQWKNVIDFFRVEKKDGAREFCFYSGRYKADSTPFRYYMLKVRDIQLENHGPFMHSVGYNRNYHEIVVPRSAHAYRIHFILSFVKPLTLLFSLIFFPVPSLIWRFILGLAATLLLSRIILLLTSTRSKTAYLFNAYTLIKIAVWFTVIISQTIYYPGLVFYNTVILWSFLAFLLLFLDMILDLILRVFPFYPSVYLPLTRQPEVVRSLFRSGYQNFLDVPVWSTLYPFFRWLF